MREIQQLSDLARRPPEAGRIRFGERGPKGEPRALDRFRFTSHDSEAIAQIAALYGGEVSLWEGQAQVIITSPEIRVVLPPDPLGGTPVYELWSGGGVQRRCDGETAWVPSQTPDGAELVDRPCLCVAASKMACTPKTRLSVVLPDIRFAGTWRLESGGWNAAHELPGMVETIQAFQDKGFVIAKLGLRRMEKVFAGKKRRYIVPYLSMDATVEQLVAGQASLQGLAPATVPPVPELEPGPGDPQPAEEAEIVADEHSLRMMFALIKECGLRPEDRESFALTASAGRTGHTRQLHPEEMDRVIKALRGIAEGRWTYRGRTESGQAIVA